VKYLPDMLDVRNHRIVKALVILAKRCMREFGGSGVSGTIGRIGSEREHQKRAGSVES